jgi:threonine synthase
MVVAGDYESLFKGLRCQKCDVLYPLGTAYCAQDRGLLLSEYALAKQKMTGAFPYDKPGIWRFSPLMPPLPRRLSRGEGNTPVLTSRKSGDTLEIDLFFKDEGANPSGSFKDRGVAVMVSALDPSTETVIMMSSGNAASSVALYSALAGVHAIVLMYQGGTRAKAFMTRAYGATVLAVHAEREADVLTLAESVAKEKGWPLMNTVAAGNPLILDGYKTLAYELSEELPDMFHA